MQPFRCNVALDWARDGKRPSANRDCFFSRESVGYSVTYPLKCIGESESSIGCTRLPGLLQGFVLLVELEGDSRSQDKPNFSEGHLVFGVVDEIDDLGDNDVREVPL